MSEFIQLVDDLIETTTAELRFASIFEGTVESGSNGLFTIKPTSQDLPRLTDVKLYSEDARRALTQGTKVLFTFLNGQLSSPVILCAQRGESEIKLGDATEPVVLGSTFLRSLNQIFMELQLALMAHTHLIIKPTPGDPVSPPASPISIRPLDASVLSTKVKTQ